jgi:HAMP domain-containing protein
MRWHHQLRWKLFFSHLVIIIIADVVLLATANFMASIGLVNAAPFTVGAETGQVEAAAGAAGTPLLGQFQTVVQQALLVSGFAALAAAVVVSLFVSRRIVEPLLTISSVSQRMAQGYYRERMRVRSPATTRSPSSRRASTSWPTPWTRPSGGAWPCSATSPTSCARRSPRSAATWRACWTA